MINKIPDAHPAQIHRPGGPLTGNWHPVEAEVQHCPGSQASPIRVEGAGVGVIEVAPGYRVVSVGLEKVSP